jgi:hypothetical protein
MNSTNLDVVADVKHKAPQPNQLATKFASKVPQGERKHEGVHNLITQLGCKFEVNIKNWMPSSLQKPTRLAVNAIFGHRPHLLKLGEARNVRIDGALQRMADLVLHALNPRPWSIFRLCENTKSGRNLAERHTRERALDVLVLGSTKNNHPCA